jgi:predicted DNA-binding transcriptional regulator AlpA
MEPAQNATDFGRPGSRLTSLLMPDEAVGVKEIADMFETTRRTVQRWVERVDFPQPKYTLAGNRRVWLTAEVEAWGAANLPLPRTGRPPKTG